MADYFDEYERALDKGDEDTEKKAFYAKFPKKLFDDFAKAVAPRDVTTALRLHMEMFVAHKKSKKKKS